MSGEVTMGGVGIDGRFNPPAPGKWLRPLGDGVELQLSLILDSPRRVAPEARGRLLDMGCGEMPYEPIFRPYVSEHIGVEHRELFEFTAASGSAASAASAGRRGPAAGALPVSTARGMT